MSTDDRDPSTVASGPAFGPTEPASKADAVEPGTLPAPGYQLGGVIGRGGMGEVVAARDLRIGREVAVKRMRAAQPPQGAIARFWREARIQARLDHPAIVPVHELGVDDAGRPYFTMKRLAGQTLARRLEQGAPIQPVLRAFVEVCLAIEFAHAHGVVHRDLKPANIMLGDYGEVYVLDWGIARAVSDPGERPTEDRTIDVSGAVTNTGDLLGTPGYMAPEQVRGERVGPAADVYALGAILFEILAGKALHPNSEAGLADTITHAQRSPADEAPERAIAPELDAACIAALAEDPSARLTAHELRERVQRYVDGDRDLERRKTLAREHLAVARAAYDSGDPEQRAIAIERAGRALALDPESVEAAQLVTTLIVEPPASMPAELASRIRAEERRAGSARMRIGVPVLLAPLTTLLLLPWLHVKNWLDFLMAYGTLAATAVVQRLANQRGPSGLVISFAMVLALSLAFSRVVGPFILTPVVITGMFTAISANRWLDGRRWLLVVWVAVVTLAPVALEAAGVLTRTWILTRDSLQSISAVFQVEGSLEAYALFVGNLMLVAAIAIFAAGVHREARHARRRLTSQAWHLGKLLPPGHAPADGPQIVSGRQAQRPYSFKYTQRP